MKLLRASAAIAVVALFSLSANAATVTLFGDDVSFTFDDSTLFGTGIVVGNNIFFLPTDFRAESLNGEGAVSVSDTLNITVEATTEGYTMTDFLLAETGDYSLSAGDTSVSASARLQVTSQTTNCPSAIPGFDLPCNEATIDNVAGLTNVGATTEWSAQTDVNLGDTAGWIEDTKVTVQLQNNLSATTLNVGEEAWIQKKSGAIGISVVPIPAAVWLFGSALGALGWIRRRQGK
jgi:hypothetical protein